MWRIVGNLKFEGYLVVLGNQWLSLATTVLVGNLKFEAYFLSVLLTTSGGQSHNFKGTLLVALGYHWLPLATT